MLELSQLHSVHPSCCQNTKISLSPFQFDSKKNSATISLRTIHCSSLYLVNCICKLYISPLPASFPCSLQSSTSFNMFRSQLLRQAARAVRAPTAFPQPIASRTLPAISFQRSIHNTTSLRQEEKKPGEEHEGQFARTDPTVEVEYPEEGDLPSSTPVQGRGGMHFRRTLPSFSLEGRVGVVTGGARGLGLVMSQAMVISGADVAIVDLNSMLSISV